MLDLQNKKNLIYLVLIIVVVGVLFFIFFSNNEELLVDDNASDRAVFDINNIRIKKLDTEIFTDEKYTNLKENKVKFKELSELNIGKKNPFLEE